MERHIKTKTYKKPRAAKRDKLKAAKSKLKGTIVSSRLIGEDGKVLKPGDVKKEIHTKMSKAFATKTNLLKQAYKMYSEDYMKANKTARPPILKTNSEVVSAVTPYLQVAAEKLPPDIYQVVPALVEMDTDKLKDAAYGLAPTIGGYVGSIFGPEGKIIGEIGAEVIAAFIKWGIEEDGFEKIGDFIADAVSEIGDFIEDAASEVGSFISDVGSALDLW